MNSDNKFCTLLFSPIFFQPEIYIFVLVAGGKGGGGGAAWDCFIPFMITSLLFQKLEVVDLKFFQHEHALTSFFSFSFTFSLFFSLFLMEHSCPFNSKYIEEHEKVTL